MINITDAAGLAGIATGNTTTTAGDGSITFSFNETTTGTYNVGFSLLETTITASSTVTVTPGDADSLTLDVSPPITKTAGESGTFTLTLEDEFGNSINGETINITDAAGLAGIATGDTATTARDGNVTFSFNETTTGTYEVAFRADGSSATNTTEVTVVPAVVDSVTLSPADTQTVLTGDTVTFGATASDTFGNLITDDVTEFDWANATVEGLFRKTSVGSYNVTATYDKEVSPATDVTVEAQPLSSTGGSGGGGGTGLTAESEPDDIETIVTIEDANETDDEAGYKQVTVKNSRATIPVILEETSEEGSSPAPLSGGENIQVDRMTLSMSADRSFSMNISLYDYDLQNGDSDREPSRTVTQAAREFEERTGTVSAGHIEVETNLDPEALEGVTFEYSVRKSYLDSLDVDESTISLLRNFGGELTELEATMIGETETHYRFKSESPGFSVFSISTGAPTITITDASLIDLEIIEDEMVPVTAAVENRGAYPREYTAVLLANGDEVVSEIISVDGQSTSEVSLSFTPAAPGEYTLTVGTVALGTVLVQPDEPDESVQPDENLTESPTDASGPGFGIIVIFAALVIMVLFLTRRRS